MLVLDRWRLLNAGVGPEITVSGRYLLGLHLLSHCIFSYLAHALPLLHTLGWVKRGIQILSRARLKHLSCLVLVVNVLVGVGETLGELGKLLNFILRLILLRASLAVSRGAADNDLLVLACVFSIVRYCCLCLRKEDRVVQRVIHGDLSAGLVVILLGIDRRLMIRHPTIGGRHF